MSARLQANEEMSQELIEMDSKDAIGEAEYQRVTGLWTADCEVSQELQVQNEIAEAQIAQGQNNGIHCLAQLEIEAEEVLDSCWGGMV